MLPDAQTLERWRAALVVTPRLAAAAGVAAIGTPPRAWAGMRAEGLRELHWRVLGDTLVRFFQHSGPVLTKLGQTLATRDDLLPPALCAQLERLYGEQPAMPGRALERALRRAYPERRPFRRFERRPLAVGSIGQVHRARLRDGTRVVVKILRPGTRDALRRDLAALNALVELVFRLVARRNDRARRRVSRSLDELARGLGREVDLELEAQNLQAFRRRLARNPNVYVPRCYREHSSGEVLVIEELRGRPLAAVRRRRRSDPRAAQRVASLALREILDQIFAGGSFHADPHGGNLWLLDDGRLGLIDLGLTGELGLEDRRRITRAARAFLSRDADRAIETLLEFGTLDDDFDVDAFKRDVRRALSARRTSSGLEGLVNDLLAVASRHEIHLPPSTTLLIKTLVTIEGVARSLDPDINVVTTALPIVLRSLAPKLLRWREWRPLGALRSNAVRRRRARRA